MTAAYGLIYPCLLYVMMRFFFPRVFLMPVMVMAGVLYVALCFARFRVVLDRADGEVAITGLWTRHVRLTQIERIEVLRSGAEIRIAGGVTYGFGPFRKRRWLQRLLPVRSGFEEMDLAITQAAAAARAADPGRAAAEDAASRRAASRRKAPLAGFACGAGASLFFAGRGRCSPVAGRWLARTLRGAAAQDLLRGMRGGGRADRRLPAAQRMASPAHSTPAQVWLTAVHDWIIPPASPDWMPAFASSWSPGACPARTVGRR